MQPDELLAALRGHLSAWDSDIGPTVTRAGQDPLNSAMIYALARHTFGLARAVLALREAGCHVQSVPLIRQAIECAYTARWLSIYRDAALSVLHEGARQRRQALEPLVEVGAAMTSEAIVLAEKLLDELDDERTSAGKSFQARCGELIGGDGIYSLFRIASGYSHAGTAIGELYVRADPTLSTGLQLAAEPTFGTEDAWLGMLLSMVVTAGLAWDSIERSHHHRSALRRTAALLQITPDAQMSNVGFVRHQKAERRQRAKRRAVGRAAR